MPTLSPPRAAIYARVSSAEQRDKHTIASQLAELPAYALAQGWSVVDTYVDDGRSAKSGQLERRDGLARLLADAAAGRVDLVCVVDLDRLSRAEDMIERATILGALQRADVKIAVMGAGVQDLRTFTGDLYATLHSAFAAQWVRQHREKIGRGKRRAIAVGKKPAGPTPYGYAYDRHAPDGARAWSIDEGQAAVVREIFARVARGESCPAVAADLERRAVPRPRGGAWQRERVYQVARARTYLGAWTASKAEAITVPVPRIVTDEQWAAADEQLRRHHRRGVRRTRHHYLLDGLGRCACGAPIGIASAIARPGDRQDVPARYLCSHRRRPPAGADRCTLPYFRAAVIDGWIWESLAELLARPDLVEEVLRRRRDRAATDGGLWQRDADAARAHLARLERAERVALGQHRAGRLSEGALSTELGALARERQAAQLQLDAALRAGAAVAADVDQARDLEAALANLRPRLTTLDDGERRAIVRELLGEGAVTFGPRVVEARFGLVAGAADVDASVGQGVHGSTSYVSRGQPIGVLRLLSTAAWAPSGSQTSRPSPDPAVVAQLVARADVPPPPYLAPASVVDGQPRSRDRRPLELRTCAGCGLTFWARADGPNRARHCSHGCYSASGARRDAR